MKSGDTIRMRPYLAEYEPRAGGLLPLPLLARALMAVGAVLCIVLVGFVWSLLQ